MALGTLVLGGIAVGPALAVGGFAIGSQGEKALTEAREYVAQANVATAQLNESKKFLEQVCTRIQELDNLLINLNNQAISALNDLHVGEFNKSKVRDVDKLQRVFLLMKAISEVIKDSNSRFTRSLKSHLKWSCRKVHNTCQALGRAKYKLMKNIGGSTNPIESVEKVVQACSDYLKIAEQECTKRRNIEAWEKITLKKIKSSSDFLMAYLERSFDERSEGFRRMFDALDRAVETGNNEQLAATLEAVVKLAQSSPFKDLSDVNSVRAALDDPDHEWEL
jgi:hypothetical protein